MKFAIIATLAAAASADPHFRMRGEVSCLACCNHPGANLFLSTSN